MQIEEISAASLSRVICKNRLYYHSLADEERRKEPSVKEIAIERRIPLSHEFFLFERLHTHECAYTRAGDLLRYSNFEASIFRSFKFFQSFESSKLSEVTALVYTRDLY